MNNWKAKPSLEELEVLLDYLSVLNILDYCRFDLSLSRGLDYYTRLIYEAVLTNKLILKRFMLKKLIMEKWIVFVEEGDIII